MSLMEAVARLAGEPHSPEPACVCPVLAAFGSAWDDALDYAEDRQRLLAPYVSRLVDTRSTQEVEERRAYMALDWLIRTYTPAWLDLQPELAEHAAALRALPEIVDLATAKLARGSVIDAESAAWSAFVFMAEPAVQYAARSAADSAARSATESAARSAALTAALIGAESAADSAALNAALRGAEFTAESAAWSAALIDAEIDAESAVWVAFVAAAARSALQSTVERLQVSAVELLDRMIAVQPEVSRD